ncbi:hypothetical protein RVIR1_04530 [Candidatus Rickettsiella viridis]|uniref:Uncharacterized protein n=1 Tax=Candidatus Rickettsiella viridis TaxID=676208 RepID=A0A2Z5UV77_9COXI|nr:hypothetical protein RVIR1_04530 [Candidatus Rickettsiella viridis]
MEGEERKNLDCKNYMENTICFFYAPSQKQLSTTLSQNNIQPLDLSMP